MTSSVYPVSAAVCCSSPSPTPSTSEALYRIYSFPAAAYVCGLAFIIGELIQSIFNSYTGAGARGYHTSSVRGESCRRAAPLKRRKDSGVKAMKSKRHEQAAPLLDISACLS